jgi:hypothetical protein
MEVRIMMSASALVAAAESAFQTQNQLATQVVQAPGTSDQTVTIEAQGLYAPRGHSYEMGIVVVDDATGKIGDLSPGDSGYAQAALASSKHQVLLSSSNGRRSHGEATIAGGSYYILYFIQDGTAASVVARNPNNVSGQQPVALFSLPAANENGQAELNHWFGRRFAWGLHTGSRRHRLPELAFRLHVESPKSPPDTKPPHASLSITGTVPTTTSFDVQFTEPMTASTLRANNFALTLTASSGAGTTIPIQSATRIDDTTVHIKLKNSLAPGNYRFDVNPAVTDLAGNALANPRSFTFTVA